MKDLPSLWQGAARTRVKSRCTRNALDGPHEPEHAVIVQAGPHGILVVKNANYRCEQPVEAFLAPTRQGVLVLIQPVTMNPRSVARCSCLYDLALPVGSATVRAVLLRTDRYGAPPTTRAIPILGHSAKVSGWLDEWKDAWEEYRITLRELYRGEK